MTIRHHPDDATLMSFAAGSLPQAFAVVVATHVGMCPRCRRELAMLEAFGGALIDTLASTSLDRLPPPPEQAASTRSYHTPHPRLASTGAQGLPSPLGSLVGTGLGGIKWRRLAWGLWRHDITLAGSSTGTLRLLKAVPGQAIPEHGHGGSELTLVLQGAYRDEIGEFGPGDVADLDDEVEHTPVAYGETDCICVIASDTPPRFRGLLPRIARPFLKI